MAWPGWPDDIAADELVTAAWLTNVSQSLAFIEEVGYAEVTADTSVTATTEATANSVVSLGAITYEAVPHFVEFQCSEARPDNGAAGRTITFVLEDSTTVVVGVWGRIATPAAAVNNMPVRLGYRFTPTAASHTYNVRAWVSAGTGLISAGSGGAADDGPAWIRICRVPT